MRASSAEILFTGPRMADRRDREGHSGRRKRGKDQGARLGRAVTLPVTVAR
jgi:hypothetical protein